MLNSAFFNSSFSFFLFGRIGAKTIYILLFWLLTVPIRAFFLSLDLCTLKSI